MKIVGNVIVGQSGGPTAAINSSLAGVFTAAKQCGADKVFGMVNGIEGILNNKFIDMSQYVKSETDVELLKRTPSSYLGSCRFKLPKVEKGNEIYEKLFAFFDKNNIKCFFYIGGNDSMDTICKLYDYGELIGSDVRFVGVPKTIDNDLEATDHTPGYGSAAKFIATVTKELVADSLVYDLESVTVVEIMGRDAGWLTAASALSKGVDCKGPALVCLPEIPFDYNVFKEKVAEIIKKKKSIVVTLSEGIRTADGKYVCELGKEASKDAFGHTMLSAAGAAVSAMLKKDLGIKTRAVELSTLQRCASHIASLTDIEESFSVGQSAVFAAASGKSGEMALLRRLSDEPYTCVCDTEDIHKIANLAKPVPCNMISADGFGVTDEFFTYARPLIEGEVSQLTVGGIPRHIDLRK